MSTDHLAADKPPFSRILAVCDKDETASETLETAVRLGALWGAQVLAFDVVDLPSDIDRLSRLSGITREKVTGDMVEERRARLAAIAKMVRPGQVPPIKIATGKLFLQVIHEVLDGGHDLVIKAAETIEGTKPMLFASTDQHLLRKCPCPVWLLSGPSATAAKTVVAAVDVDDFAHDQPAVQAGLNERIIMIAAHIAAVQNADLHVLYARDAMDESSIRHWASGRQSAEQLLRQIDTDDMRNLVGLISRCVDRLGGDLGDRVAIEPHLLRGQARQAIAGFIEDKTAALLVMGTIARTGVPGFIIGNTAEDILNSVECSIVTVKPPGYVSPVAR